MMKTSEAIQTLMIVLGFCTFVVYQLGERLVPKSWRSRLLQRRTVRRRQKYERESLKQKQGRESSELAAWQEGFRARWLDRKPHLRRAPGPRDPEMPRTLWMEGWEAADAEQTPKTLLVSPGEPMVNEAL
jgi:hypothetical protein